MKTLLLLLLAAGCGSALPSEADCPQPSSVDPEKLQGTVTYPATLPDCVCDKWTRGPISLVLSSDSADGCYYAWETVETCGACTRTIDFIYDSSVP